MKRMFFSDLHMNVNISMPGDKQEYIWLDRITAEALEHFLDSCCHDDTLNEVILVGDIFDDNVCPIDRCPPSFEEIMAHFPGIMNYLRSLAQSKKLYYVHGNHDVSLHSTTLIQQIPGIIIVPNSIFLADLIHAEHGNERQIWCAADNRPNNAFAPFPIGYFISRMAATQKVRVGESLRQVSEIVHYALLRSNIREVKTTIVAEVFEFVRKWVKLQSNDQVYLPGDRAVNLQTVLNNYLDLYSYWEKAFPNTPSYDYVIDWESFVGKLCLQNNKLIVIDGHSHHSCTRNVFCDRYIHANCGSWIDGKLQFVEIVDGSNHQYQVRMMKWNDSRKTAEHCGETLFLQP